MSDPARASCRNCGASLHGEYCFAFGQREGRADVHMGEVIGELFGDVFRWDSRLWSTLLPLLFRPVYLTHEFIEGRRARYVPPFRLYLIISFTLFLVLSLSSIEPPPRPVGRARYRYERARGHGGRQ